MSVWLIESGEYSDYRVHAVAADEATARAICDRLNAAHVGGYYSFVCSERAMITSPDEVEIVNRCWRAVARLVDGEVAVTAEHLTWASPEPVWPGDDDVDVNTYTGEVRATADTEERARKIACDSLAKWRAERELDPQP